METAFLKAGTRLGPFELEQKLALGGMAEIWAAREDLGTGKGRRVALKVLQPFFAQDSGLVAMFEDELSLAQRLTHPGIVRTYGGHQYGDWIFQSMELLDGIDLRRVLSDLAKAGAWMRVPMALRVARDAALALQSAHALTNEAGQSMEVVHRDVSPHNLMLTREGQVKVIDFGIARAAERMTQTKTGIIKGKLSYMAPEQALSQPVTARTDIFSLGIVLWELLTMRRLFRGRSDIESLSLVAECQVPKPGELNPMLPESAAALLEAMLAKDPDERPSSMAAVASRLDAVLERGFEEHGHSDRALANFVNDLLEPRTVARRVTQQFQAPAELPPKSKSVSEHLGNVPDPAATPAGTRRSPETAAHAKTEPTKLPEDLLHEPSLPGGRSDGDLALSLTSPGALDGPAAERGVVLGYAQLREGSQLSAELHPAPPPSRPAASTSVFDEPTEAVSGSQPELQQLLVMIDDTVLSNPNPTPPPKKPTILIPDAQTSPAPTPLPRKPRRR